MSAKDHQAAYRRRNQLARQRGFKSYSQQRRYARIPTTGQQLGQLPDRARERRAEALDVINAARQSHRPVAEVATERNVPMAAVAWWGQPALEKPASRSPKVKTADRLLRAHPLVADGELQIITTRGSNAARKAQEAFRLQRAFMEGEPGATEALAKLQGARVGGHTVETEPAVLEEIGRRGELGDITEMYRAWLS